MDGARKKVRKLAQHFLPERPHHLALSPTERYPEPTTFWQHNSRLQYSTYLSDADRGVLLTRPYYDIRQEPESATASNNDSAHAGSRPEMKKAVTKMSFKDYQNKQKKLSESPPDSGASAPRATDAKSQSGESKPSRDGPRREELSSKASGHRQDAKVAPRQEINGERSKLKTAPIGAPSPSLENKKRSADHDDSPRPQKRNKSDSVSQVDRVHTPRSDTQRGSQDSASTQTKQPNRDNRLLANGRSNLEGGKDGARPTGASPRPVVNGTKSQNTSSSQTTPKKPDSGGKSTVPPLLSPLRLPLGEDRGPKSPKKRPTEGNTALKAPPKPIKSDTNSSQKQKHSSIIPPLLSPTLPPVLEQEIARMKRTSSKGDSSQGTRQSSESPGSIKKSRAPQDDDADRPRAPQKPSLIVTLKYKKRNALRVQRLLALPPTHEKDARRKERSESMEDTPPPARKHLVEDAIAVKRPNTSSDKTVGSKSLAAPSTPVKTYSMSRGPSSNSQTAQTPGDSTTLTPGTNDRPPTSHSGENGAVAPSSSTLRSRHAQFTSLGTKLKHDRDNIIKARGASSRSGEFLSLLTTSERKRVAALSLEMVMAYMIAFKSLNQARALDRKACDFKPWEDLLPHLVELRNFTRAFQPLDALAVQLRAVCLEQLADAYSASSISSQDAAQVAGPKLVKLNRKRGEAWAEAYQCLLGIADEGMKATVGPWYGADEVVRVLLPVIRKWADKEGSSWRPEIVLP